MKKVAVQKLRVQFHHLWSEQWLLLTAGDFRKKDYNCMTIGWGSLGTMWSKPFVQVVVRPVRHTFRYMEKYDTFTVCAFPPEQRQALQVLGSRSGREGDKIGEAGLTPVASRAVAAPGFAEADLILECRKMYFDDIRPERFLAADIAGNYPKRDYHRIYFGEIVVALSTDRYL